MTVLGKNNVFKRIAAFVLAVLMVFSLLPMNTMIIWADTEEGAADRYTFQLKLGEEPVNMPEGTRYRFLDNNSNELNNGTLDANGAFTVAATNAEGTSVITKNSTYKVECVGYKQVEVTITDEMSYTSILVPYTATINGSITLPEGSTSYDGVSATLYQSPLTETETPVAVQAPVSIGSDGSYKFENVDCYASYYVEITSANNRYQSAKIDVDLTAPEGDAPTITNGPITLTANTDLDFFIQEQVTDVFLGESITIVPTVTLGEQLVTEGYQITYKIQEENEGAEGGTIPVYATVANEKVTDEENSEEIITNNAVVTAGTLSPDEDEKTVTIIATLTGENYVTKEISFQVTVKRKSIEGFAFVNIENSKVELNYGEQSEYQVNVEIPDGMTGIYYNITDELEDADVASIEENGKITIQNAGTATVTATLPAQGNYKSGSISFTLEIKPKEQSGAIVIKENDTEIANALTYEYVANATHTFVAQLIDNENIVEAADITYAVTAVDGSACDDIATIDKNGVLSILKTGTIKLIVTSKQANHIDLTKEVTITISKADVAMSFGDVEKSEFVNGEYFVGECDFKEPTLTSSVNDNITYTSSHPKLVEVDASTGEITFLDLKTTEGDVEVTITAERPEDEVYSYASATYTITIKDWIPEKDITSLYTISGDGKLNPASEWYTTISEETPLVVTAKDGYKIFEEAPDKEIANAEASSISISTLEEGENTISFYLMEVETGKVTGVCNTAGIKVDTTTPSASIVVDELEWWENVLNFLPFIEDIHPTFTIETAENVTEGTMVSDVTAYYYISNSLTELTDDELKALEDSDWTEITAGEEAELAFDNTYIIYAKVVDEAGHCDYTNTNGLIADHIAPTIELEPNTESDYINGYFTGEKIKVTVDVTDMADEMSLSGLSKIEYWVGDQTGESVKLEEFPIDNNTTYDQLTHTYSETIEIDTVNYNNEDGVTLYVQAMDNAGNVSEVKEIHFNVSLDEPIISITYDNDEIKETKDDVNYYDAERTATVVINSRADVYVKENVQIWLNGEQVSNDTLTWDDENQSVDIEFPAGSKVDTFKVEYTDKLDRTISKEESKFVVDMDDPTGEAAIGTNKWSELLNILTFGLWDKTFEVELSANDATSEVTAQYYISNTTEILTKTELEALEVSKWTNYTDKISLGTDNRYAVYFKLTDIVGHVTYISTDGFVVDNNSSEIVTLTPTTQPNENGYYNDDVEMNVHVEEPDGTYSGIDTIKYWIQVDDGERSEEITLFDFDVDEPNYDDLVNTKEVSFMVDAEIYNGENVLVHVDVVDNSGNVSYKEEVLKINSTPPVVNISYDNNNGLESNGTYFFDELRTATITITDSTEPFDENAAKDAITISLTDKEQKAITDHGIAISDWRSEGDTHKATIKFTQDGYYTLAVDYTNKAGLSHNQLVETESGTVAPLSFVIDRVDPEGVSVSALENKWQALLETLTFGLFPATDVEVTATGTDTMSNVTFSYYIANNATPKNVTELRNLPENVWKNFENGFTVSKEQRMSIYIRVEDQAGNDVYVNTNGIILDKTAAAVTLIPDAPNANGVYNKNVNVGIHVDDSAVSSGIKEIEYWITADGVETKRETLHTFTKTNPSMLDLVATFDKMIMVKASENNSSNVVVYVRVKDNAGKEITVSKKLDIDITAPTIDISYDNNQNSNLVNGKGYFQSSRTATIVVKERTNHFNANEFKNNIKLTATDVFGNVIEDAMPVITYVGTKEGDNADAAQHTFKVSYAQNANYTFAVSYTDKAGNGNKPVAFKTGTVAPNSFVIDSAAPDARVEVQGLGFWETLLQIITFGLWSPSEVDVTITATDINSPVASIMYLKSSETDGMTVEELKKATNWTTYQPFKITDSERTIIYGKITDTAGNIRYISTDGIIVDKEEPIFETLAPMITINPEQPINGIYTGDVKVDVQVEEPAGAVNGSYSGLKQIRYEVYNMGVKTQDGVLFEFQKSNPVYNELVQTWNQDDIVVSAAKNNSNDVVIKVFAEDNAGNKSESSTTIKIDTTSPTIQVSYDNNNGDTTFADSVYYNQGRTANITIRERNFDASKVKLSVTNTDGVIPGLSEWTKISSGTGNGDDTTYVATVYFTADGDYTFDISCADIAENTNTPVNYGDSQAPTAFTIDKIAPTISISYDNNDALNENYFKADRTATVVIHEHNFDASRVNAMITATDDGQDIAAPAISGWSSSGDTHTAYINYSSDALYTFDIDYTDKAGNAMADVEPQTFYVDKTTPQVSITEIEDLSANNAEKIGFVITATDTNFDVFTPVLTAVTQTENGFATTEMDVASIAEITNGQVYTVDNLEADGIYSITCSAIDKAGNAYTEVNLQRADGSTYVESRAGEDTLIMFSVNRLGSTFDVDANTKDILDKYYVQNVENDLVIYEVNTNELLSYSISLNGEELREGTDYTVSNSGGNGEWMRYTYTVNKNLFANEGEYVLVISSTDGAENNAFSDVKNTNISFVVDRTAPVVTVTGMESGRSYQTDRQTVTLMPTDDGGIIETLMVRLVDRDGNVLEEILNMSGDKLREALETNGGTITFDLSEGLNQNIQIICGDGSYNAQGQANTFNQTFEDVSVSASALAIFFAGNTMLYIGGGASAAAATAGTTVFFIKRRRGPKVPKALKKGKNK